jgi:hypothetical protein
MMGFETVYSYLIESAGFFLGSWVVFLLAAYVMTFGNDAPPQKG